MEQTWHVVQEVGSLTVSFSSCSSLSSSSVVSILLERINELPGWQHLVPLAAQQGSPALLCARLTDSRFVDWLAHIYTALE
jgi:hypothetical protein